MRFQSIELENYRQYREKQTIEFSQDPKKNFTILQAPNGAGKTNLLSSIYWCFYNNEENITSKYEDTKSLGILNESTMQELHVGKSAKVAVKITLGEKNKPEYILERINTFEKNHKGSVHLIDESFRILVYADGGFTEEVNVELAMNRILPKEIKNFFFFDGEKLDSFFRIGSGTNIKKAVYDVSQIGLLNNTLKHLDFVKRDMMKNHVDLDPQIGAIQKKVEESDKILNDRKQEFDRLQKEIDEANTQIYDIDQYLREHSVSNVSEKQKQREQLELNLKENHTKLEDINEERRKALVNIMPYIYLKKTAYNLLKQIDKLDEEKSLPPDIKPSFVKKLLDKKECICGTTISKDSKEEKKISKLLQKNDYGDNAKILLEGRAELSDIDEKISDFKLDILKHHKEITDINKKSDNIKKGLEEIRLHLEGVDVEEVSKKESHRTTLYNAVQSSVRAHSLCDQDIKDLTAHIAQLRKDWSQLTGKKSENKEVLVQVNLVEESHDVIEKILSEIVTEVRQTIENKTNEYFLNLIWKKDVYKIVKIDEGYNLSVLNKYGSECLGSLSAGERQVLALSFMAALKEVSGFDIPVIIDTPLGRISGEPRENIAKSLPSYLKDTQVTLLMTDTEYTPKLKSILGERIGKEYVIKFNEQSSESKVV